MVHDPARGIVVADALELAVKNERDCVELMQRGIAARAVSATAMNAGSSRSHCVVGAPAGWRLWRGMRGWGSGGRARLGGARAAQPVLIQPAPAPPHSHPGTTPPAHRQVYLVVKKEFPDGRAEYGKLCLVVSGRQRADGPRCRRQGPGWWGQPATAALTGQWLLSL